MSITAITAISFYWRNEMPSFVTWWSRLATAPDTPTCIVIHSGQFTGGVHPQNQFVPVIVSHLSCSSYITDFLFFIECLFFQRTYFFHRLPWQMPLQRFERMTDNKIDWKINKSVIQCNLANIIFYLFLFFSPLPANNQHKNMYITGNRKETTREEAQASPEESKSKA